MLASNHRSFLDPFVIGMLHPPPGLLRRQAGAVRQALAGWLLNCLGAFPIRRGEADEESMETARQLLERGDVVVDLPRGHAHPEGSLGQPKRGVGRLALETGAPVVPIAVHRHRARRRGWKIRPVKVKIRFGRPLTFPRVEKPSQRARLRGDRPRSGRASSSSGSGSAACRRCARPPCRRRLDGHRRWPRCSRAPALEVQLGCRTAEQAETHRGRRTQRRAPARLELPDGVTASPSPTSSSPASTSSCFAVPSRVAAGGVAELGARVPERAAVLVLSKGLVPAARHPALASTSPHACTPAPSPASAARSTPRRQSRTAPRAVLASADRDFRAQLGDALERAGIDVERTSDVVGAELAGLREERGRARRRGGRHAAA